MDINRKGTRSAGAYSSADFAGRSGIVIVRLNIGSKWGRVHQESFGMFESGTRHHQQQQRTLWVTWVYTIHYTQ